MVSMTLSWKQPSEMSTWKSGLNPKIITKWWWGIAAAPGTAFGSCETSLK
jgi:hypothetical protein